MENIKIQKKERLFYLDFVRAIATILIVLCHYNAVFAYAGIQNYIIDVNFFDLYVGSIGVSLFLIISGASLYYVYMDDFDLKNFYKKRFFSIFPMYWKAYTIAFIVIYILKRNWFVSQTPKWHLLFSFLGIDGLLSTSGVTTFYILGEWFLGFIILFYIVFPLLKYLIENFPKLLLIGIISIFIILQVVYPFKCLPTVNLFIRLPELLFGMYFMKYIKKVNLSTFLVSLSIIIITSIVKPSFSQDIKTLYIGISLFLILVYISQFVSQNMVIKSCEKICKYSYSIFLVHHVIIYYLMQTINIANISRIENYLIFVGMCVLIYTSAIVLYYMDKYTKKYFKQVCLILVIFYFVLFGYTVIDQKIKVKNDKCLIEKSIINELPKLPTKKIDQSYKDWNYGVQIDYVSGILISNNSENMVNAILQTEDVVTISGWALDLENQLELSELYAVIGETVINVEYGLDRPEVFPIVFNKEGTSKVGFRFKLPKEYFISTEGKMYSSLSFYLVSKDGSFMYEPVIYKLANEN